MCCGISVRVWSELFDGINLQILFTPPLLDTGPNGSDSPMAPDVSHSHMGQDGSEPPIRTNGVHDTIGPNASDSPMGPSSCHSPMGLDAVCILMEPVDCTFLMP